MASEEINAAERRIGMAFDADYRDFVRRYGAMISSLPIFGLRHAEVMSAESVIEVTSRFRADGWEPAQDWIVISMDLAGNPIGLNAKGEVWISDHDFGEIRMVCQTFELFVRKLLDAEHDW